MIPPELLAAEGAAYDDFRRACARFADALEAVHTTRKRVLATVAAVSEAAQRSANHQAGLAAIKLRTNVPNYAPPEAPPAPRVPDVALPADFKPTPILTADRARLLLAEWGNLNLTQPQLWSAFNALPGTPMATHQNLTWYAEKLGLPTSRKKAGTPRPSISEAAPAIAKPGPTPPAAPVMTKPAPPPPVAPPPPPPPRPATPPVAAEPEADAPALTPVQEKALAMLQEGREPPLVERHTRLPLREVYRLQGLLRDAARAGVPA